MAKKKRPGAGDTEPKDEGHRGAMRGPSSTKSPNKQQAIDGEVLTPHQMEKARDRAAHINELYGRSIASMIMAGQELVEAKASLLHGQWQYFVEQLQFSHDTALRLMAIARHPVLAKKRTLRFLPLAITTLVTLSKLSDERLEEFLKAGKITPDMTHADAEALTRTIDLTVVERTTHIPVPYYVSTPSEPHYPTLPIQPKSPPPGPIVKLTAPVVDEPEPEHVSLAKPAEQPPQTNIVDFAAAAAAAEAEEVKERRDELREAQIEATIARLDFETLDRQLRDFVGRAERLLNEAVRLGASDLLDRTHGDLRELSDRFLDAAKRTRRQ